MLYDGVMPLKEEFFGKKILEKPRKKGDLRGKKPFFIYIITQRTAKVKRKIQKSFNQDKNFDFYR
jgi:hypothetical protein